MSKDRSEWGRINDGQPYGLLATDVGRAIFGVRIPWGTYELPLLHYLMEHCWGGAKRKSPGDPWPDPVSVQINFGELATNWEVPRQRLYEGRDGLLAKGFAVEKEDGSFSINKNAHQWVIPGTDVPLLKPKMLVYAVEGRRKKSSPDKQTSVTLGRARKSRPSVTDVSINQANVCHATPCQEVTPQRDNVSRPSVTTPVDDRARKKTLETLDVGVINPTPPARVRGEADREPFESENPDLPPEIVGPGCDSPEALVLEAWARSLGQDARNESYAYWARQACDLAPPRWVRLILERNVQGRSGGGRKPIPYLATILARQRSQRRSDYEVAAGGLNGHPAASGLRPSEARIVPIHRAEPDPDRPPPRPRNATPSPNGPPKEPTR